MPKFQLPTDQVPTASGPGVAPIYIDGIPLDELQSLMSSTDAPHVAHGGNAEIEFWSTIPRLNTKPPIGVAIPFHEILDIRFSTPSLLNQLSMQVPRFPHAMQVYYQPDLDSSSQPGVYAHPLLDIHGQPCQGSITDSLPAIIPPMPAGYYGHPQHFGAGHWVDRNFDLKPIKVARLIILMNRLQVKNVPVGTDRKPIPYSLGIRNLKAGYQISGRQSVPSTPRDGVSIAQRAAFSTTMDIGGNSVELSVRENRASDVGKGGFWKCEPQPIPNAVVNFFIDARDSSGAPQSIDGFYLDPLVSGPSMNIYYSLEPPTFGDTFDAPDDPITFPLLQPHGAYQATSDGIVLGDGFGYLDLDNSVIQWDITRSWWAGLTFTPTDASDFTEDVWIFDNGDVSIWWDASLQVLHAQYAGVVATAMNASLSVGLRTSILVGFDAQQQMLTLYTDDMTFAQVSTEHATPSREGFPSLTGMPGVVQRFGGHLASDPGFSRMRLEGVIVKYGAPPISQTQDPGEDTASLSSDEWETYLADPRSYILGTPGGVGDTSESAICRFVPDFIYSGDVNISLNPMGFVGGSPNHFGDITWTPVLSNYRVSRGELRFPPTQARCFKFEFTNLTAMPYDDYRPAVRSVQVFPETVASSAPTTDPNKIASQTPSTARTGSLGDARIATGVAATTMTYEDQGRLYVNNTPVLPPKNYKPTTGVYSTDPVVAARLRAKGIVYNNLQNWHPSPVVPQFTTVMPHYYETVQISHTQRVAFFVGLSDVRMLRADFTVAEDTAQYIEPFLDSTHIQTQPQVQTVDSLTIPTPTLDLPDASPTYRVRLGIAEDTSIQNFAIDQLTGEYYVTQTYPNPDGDFEDTLVSRCLPDGTLADTALLVGGGHGTTIGLENTPDGVYLWFWWRTDTTGTANVHTVRWRYRAGASITRDDPSVEELPDLWGGKYVCYSIDQQSGTVAVRTIDPSGLVDYYEQRDLDDYKAGTDTVLNRVGPYEITGNAIYQGHATTGEHLYRFMGNSDQGDPHVITGYEWTTGDSQQLDVTSASADTPGGHNEAEGIATLNDGGVLFAASVGPAGGRLADVYQLWPTLPDVPTEPTQPTTGGVIPGGWSIRDTGGLVAPSAFDGIATCQSLPYGSEHRVTGVQFATQQSNPKQLLRDPDLYDSSLSSWVSVGDVELNAGPQQIGALAGNLAVNVRNPGATFWGYLEEHYPQWGMFEQEHLTWGDISAAQGAPSPIGGMASELVSTEYSQGRMYAAVRVFVDKPLGAPLCLRILDENGNVLSSQWKNPRAGQVNEWYCSYELEPPTESIATWYDVESQITWGGVETNDDSTQATWGDVVGYSTGYSGKVSAELVQLEPTEDTWKVDNISIFLDPITWEFSYNKGADWVRAYDVRNNPAGVVMFPPAAKPEDGRSLSWRVSSSSPLAEVHAMAIRPWYDVAPRGRPYTTSMESTGADLDPSAVYPPIWKDPRWQTMQTPLPTEWWYSFRVWLASRGITLQGPTVTSVVLPQNIMPMTFNEESV